MPTHESDLWRVVIYVAGAADSMQHYEWSYNAIPGATAEEAVDFVLDHYVQFRDWELPMRTVWSVVGAWVVPDDAVVGKFAIEPVDPRSREPPVAFRRRPADGSATERRNR